MTPNPNWQVTKPLILHSSWPPASLFFLNWQLAFYCFLRLTVYLSISAQRIIQRSSWKLQKVPGQNHRKTTQHHKTQVLNFWGPEQASDSRFERKLSRLTSVQNPKTLLSEASRWVSGRLLCKTHFYDPSSSKKSKNLQNKLMISK